MKPFQINFIEDNRWKIVLAATGILVIGIALVTGWKLSQLAETKSEIDEQIRKIQVQLMQLKANTPVNVSPRQDAMAQAKLILGQDLNKLFGTIEGMSEKGARLISVDFDAAGGTIRLSYDLEAIDRVQAVTEALNGGYDKAPWRLEGVNMSGAATATPAQFRAIWSSSLERL